MEVYPLRYESDSNPELDRRVGRCHITCRCNFHKLNELSCHPRLLYNPLLYLRRSGILAHRWLVSESGVDFEQGDIHRKFGEKITGEIRCQTVTFPGLGKATLQRRSG